MRTSPRETPLVRNKPVAEKDDYLVDMLVDLGFVSAEQVAKAYGIRFNDRHSIKRIRPGIPATCSR